MTAGVEEQLPCMKDETVTTDVRSLAAFEVGGGLLMSEHLGLEQPTKMNNSSIEFRTDQALFINLISLCEELITQDKWLFTCMVSSKVFLVGLGFWFCLRCHRLCYPKHSCLLPVTSRPAAPCDPCNDHPPETTSSRISEEWGCLPWRSANASGDPKQCQVHKWGYSSNRRKMEKRHSGNES